MASTSSPIGWKCAETWVSECLGNHSQCNQAIPGGSWWPSRLLEIGGTGHGYDVRLIETSEGPHQLGSYMTLSHCWGEAEFLKLTIENQQRLKDGIRKTELPKTFQEAIDVATRFKISYLWIDSLCIIQDSAEDWNKEAVLMSDVYQHAICNIAATGATDSTKGLFFSRNTSTFQPCKISILSVDEKKMKTINIKDPRLWTYNVEDAPLIKRAWVVQERLLARRVLHFSQQQIFWECRENSACEYYPEGLPRDMVTNFKHIDINTDLPNVGSEDDEVLGIRWEKIWSRILSNYSAARLSHLEDKEVALGGITKALEALFEDKCVAGLWTSTFIQQLL